MSRHIEIRRLTLFAVIVALLVTGCGGSTPSIVGEWQVTNADLVFEFFQDNTVTLAQAGRTFTSHFHAPPSGTFKYYCDLAGHRAAGEEGQLVVSP